MKRILTILALTVSAVTVSAQERSVRGELKTTVNATNVAVVAIDKSHAQAGGIYIDGARVNGNITANTTLKNAAVVAISGSKAQIGGVYIGN